MFGVSALFNINEDLASKYEPTPEEIGSTTEEEPLEL